MNEFEQDRNALSGLHFAQDSMRPIERATLHGAERMMARCDAVLHLHQPGGTYCIECESRWPCATVRAITGEDRSARDSS